MLARSLPLCLSPRPPSFSSAISFSRSCVSVCVCEEKWLDSFPTRTSEKHFLNPRNKISLLRWNKFTNCCQVTWINYRAHVKFFKATIHVICLFACTFNMSNPIGSFEAIVLFHFALYPLPLPKEARDDCSCECLFFFSFAHTQTMWNILFRCYAQIIHSITKRNRYPFLLHPIFHLYSSCISDAWLVISQLNCNLPTIFFE